MSNQNTTLQEMSNDARLDVYEKVLSVGVQHIWSKGKLQKDRLEKMLNILLPLTDSDPIFLAHLTAYIFKKSDSKDLKVILAYVNSLSDADGQPFDPNDPEICKPNFRQVSYALMQELDPKLMTRLYNIAGLFVGKNGKLYNDKRDINGTSAVHITRGLRKASQKYLRFRELSPKAMNGVVRSGLRNTVANLYRLAHINPLTETAKKLRWVQKDGSVTKSHFGESMFDFTGLKDVEIAKRIVDEKLSPMTALGAIEKVTPVIAVALLQVATGDQVVILTGLLEDQGLLSDKKVQKVYEQKVAESRNAIDRIKSFKDKTSVQVQNILDESRAKSKQNMFSEKSGGMIEKVFIHLDISSSMDNAIAWTRANAGVIAEMVNDPENNFGWGAYNARKIALSKPKKFTQAGFQQALYGLNSSGSTNCFAHYEDARKFGADVDIHITDQGHNAGELTTLIRQFHHNNEHNKPKACVIIDTTAREVRTRSGSNDENSFTHNDKTFTYYSGGKNGTLAQAYEQNGIPVCVLPHMVVDNTALLTEQIVVAMKGKVAIIEEILNTDLPELPDWFVAMKV